MTTTTTTFILDPSSSFDLISLCPLLTVLTFPHPSHTSIDPIKYMKKGVKKIKRTSAKRVWIQRVGTYRTSTRVRTGLDTHRRPSLQETKEIPTRTGTLGEAHTSGGWHRRRQIRDVVGVRERHAPWSRSESAGHDHNRYRSRYRHRADTAGKVGPGQGHREGGRIVIPRSGIQARADVPGRAPRGTRQTSIRFVVRYRSPDGRQIARGVHGPTKVCDHRPRVPRHASASTDIKHGRRLLAVQLRPPWPLHEEAPRPSQASIAIVPREGGGIEIPQALEALPPAGGPRLGAVLTDTPRRLIKSRAKFWQPRRNVVLRRRAIWPYCKLPRPEEHGRALGEEVQRCIGTQGWNSSMS
jgi:hypothetical protein